MSLISLLMFRTILFFFLFAGAVCACKSNKRIISQDLSFLYNTDSPVFKHKILFEGDSVRLFVSLSKNEKIQSFDDLINRFEFNGYKAFTYSDGDVINLDVVAMRLIQYWDLADKIIIQYSIGNGKPGDVFFVKVNDLIRQQFRLIDFGQVYRKVSPERMFLLEGENNVPAIGEYYYTDQPFRLLNSGNKKEDSVSFAFYTLNFGPAPRPYHTIEQNYDRMISEPEFTGTMLIGEEQKLDQEGVIVFSSNKEIPGCFSYLIKSSHYPAIGKAEELLEPLRYITSDTEFDLIKGSDDPKIAIDSFWLNIGGSIEYSRMLIKHYYGRVEFANKFFTTYKEGWKTDKGMVFIMFGKPDIVVRYGDVEEWQYDRLINKDFLTFTFYKQPFLLSSDHFELNRSEKYRKIWDSMIDNWRKGIIIKNNNL